MRMARPRTHGERRGLQEMIPGIKDERPNFRRCATSSIVKESETRYENQRRQNARRTRLSSSAASYRPAPDPARLHQSSPRYLLGYRTTILQLSCSGQRGDQLIQRPDPLPSAMASQPQPQQQGAAAPLRHHHPKHENRILKNHAKGGEDPSRCDWARSPRRSQR